MAACEDVGDLPKYVIPDPALGVVRSVYIVLPRRKVGPPDAAAGAERHNHHESLLSGRRRIGGEVPRGFPPITLAGGARPGILAPGTVSRARVEGRTSPGDPLSSGPGPRDLMSPPTLGRLMPYSLDKARWNFTALSGLAGNAPSSSSATPSDVRAVATVTPSPAANCGDRIGGAHNR